MFNNLDYRDLCSLSEDDADLLQHFHPPRIICCESTPGHHLVEHCETVIGRVRVMLILVLLMLRPILMLMLILTCQRMLMMGTLKSLDRRKSSPDEDKNFSISISA